MASKSIWKLFAVVNVGIFVHDGYYFETWASDLVAWKKNLNSSNCLRKTTLNQFNRMIKVEVHFHIKSLCIYYSFDKVTLTEDKANVLLVYFLRILVLVLSLIINFLSAH